MYRRLNEVESSLHLTGTTKLEITNRHFPPAEKLNIYTIHLNDHKPGEFTIELDIDRGYMYLTNLSKSSINFRLNNGPSLSHIQKLRKVALMRNDQITLFVPYIDQNNNSNSCQLKIHLLDDLSLKLEIT